MKKMKQRMYLAFVALLWSAAALFGCGGSDTVNATQRNSKFLYAVNSDDATVSGFTINAGSGVLAPVGMAVATGAIPQYPAATKDGKFLYVANDSPTASSVSGYRINSATGVLTPTTPATFKTTGDTQPLGIAIDPTSTHVYTANVSSISAFNIDPAGRPFGRGRYASSFFWRGRSSGSKGYPKRAVSVKSRTSRVLTFVVLGGSSGIGLAVAQQVVARGARAIIASSNAERVQQAVATLDGKAEGHTLDLSNERDIQNFFQKIGDFDHLVFVPLNKFDLS